MRKKCRVLDEYVPSNRVYQSSPRTVAICQSFYQCVGQVVPLLTDYSQADTLGLWYKLSILWYKTSTSVVETLNFEPGWFVVHTSQRLARRQVIRLLPSVGGSHAIQCLSSHVAKVLSLCHTLANFISLSRARAFFLFLSLSLSHSLSLSLSLSLSHTNTFALALSLSHSRTHVPSLSHTHAHTLSHSHTLTHSLTHTCR